MLIKHIKIITELIPINVRALFSSASRIDKIKYSVYQMPMDERLIIELGDLPEEGKMFSGELSASVLKMDDKDLAKAVAPLFYDVHVQRFEGELLLRGSLESTFELTCVRTNHPFTQTFYNDEADMMIAIQGGAVDCTEALREEILIILPHHPVCDDQDEGEPCILDISYFAVDKTPNDVVNESPACDEETSESPQGSPEWGKSWDALDKLDDIP